MINDNNLYNILIYKKLYKADNFLIILIELNPQKYRLYKVHSICRHYILDFR